MPMMPTLGYQNTGSMYGMPMGMNMGMMGNGSVHGSQMGGFNGMQVPLPSPMNALGGGWGKDRCRRFRLQRVLIRLRRLV